MIGSLVQSTPVDQVFKEPGVQYDAARFNWIGNPIVDNLVSITPQDVQRIQTGLVRCDRYEVVDYRIADPIELCRIIRNALLLKDLVQRRALNNASYNGSVFRSHIVEPVRGDTAAGTRLVLNHNGGIAGDMPGERPADQARIRVIAAAGIEADDDSRVLP